MGRGIKIRVETIVRNARPTSYDVHDGVDYDAWLTVTDEAGITSAWRGELTYSPDHDGNLVPYGTSIHTWMSAGLIRGVREPWIAAHDRLVDAIIEALGGGVGEEEFTVT